jgi:hypothetical protein
MNYDETPALTDEEWEYLQESYLEGWKDGTGDRARSRRR